MKQPKKLTRRQKEKLARLKIDIEDWMLVDENKILFRIINKHTGVQREIPWR